VRIRVVRSVMFVNVTTVILSVGRYRLSSRVSRKNRRLCEDRIKDESITGGKCHDTNT